MHKTHRIIGILLCCIILGSGVFIYNTASVEEESITAKASEDEKEYKWTKRVVDKDTTIDAAYLWPDEPNPSFTGVYRDGNQLPEEKMVTVTEGSVYHFRGTSDTSILYTEVYVGTAAALDITSGESGTWYKLLPSSIRSTFEAEGWKWEIGWEYDGRAYLDAENKKVMIKENDPTAVLYGVGLYLDTKQNYSENVVFTEDNAFINKFGSTDNQFASALEYYYTKSGELKSTCPDVYAFIAGIMSDQKKALEQETTSKPATTEQPKENQAVASENEPVLVKDLLVYANNERAEAGLSEITWDKANNKNTKIRAKEVSQKLSETRPDGTSAFSAYTDSVKCEIRMSDVSTIEDIYESAETYFYNKNLKSINCAVYGDVGVLIFIW